MKILPDEGIGKIEELEQFVPGFLDRVDSFEKHQAYIIELPD